MNKIIIGLIGMMLSFHIFAAEYVIAVKECFLKRNYVVSPIKTDSIKKAKRFNSRDEAELYLKELSPSLTKKKPRIIELKS